MDKEAISRPALRFFLGGFCFWEYIFFFWEYISRQLTSPKKFRNEKVKMCCTFENRSTYYQIAMKWKMKLCFSVLNVLQGTLTFSF